MSRLARQNKVLFVEPAGYFRDTLIALRSQGRGILQRAQLESPLPNLWVYRPPAFAPISGRAPLSNITFAWRRHQLRQTLQQLDMSDPILWVFQYHLGEMIGQLDERLTIYHAVDEYSAYTDVKTPEQRQRIQRLEAAVIRQVDLVFVTSPALHASKSKLHPHVVLTPNGVDYNLFANPQLNGQRPPDMAHLSLPIIGYIGAINEKLDLDLLIFSARRHPDWSFVLVGPVLISRQLQQLQTLQQLPNVHFFGQRPYQELPQYMRACDICTIPYQRNEWTRNISSLKLYEYLANGAPIVSTDIPAAREFADVVHIANDPLAFDTALSQALQEAGPAQRQKLQAVARQHTWEQRIEDISAAIEQHLASKNKVNPTITP
ncbi:MAG: glycosyltransferase family 1 protein [Chloroflexi bacterium]|nr:glycosyltransferase family 1 protein [Chloroflexota bacterium]